MPVIASFMVPHPPMIVPDVGRGSEEQIRETISAYERVADEIAELAPDTIVITSPHSIMYADYFHISPGRKAKGSFAGFRAPRVKFEETYDEELVAEICRLASLEDLPAGTMGERDKSLDHGTMVPLWFIRNKYSDGRIVRVGLSGLPLTDHYRLGMMIRDAADNTGRRVVMIGSGDLSHKLQDYGPYGFAPEGPVYDERIMDVMGRAAFGELFDFDENFCDKAAECGHRSFVIMAGAFDGVAVRAEKLSHQDVTGVGYGICTFYPVPGEAGSQESAADASCSEADAGSQDRHFLAQYLANEQEKIDAKREASDEYVRLARQAIEIYIGKRERISVPQDLPEELLTRRAGAFVSIHKQGSLRGCIGTIGPTEYCLAQEIINNAISASTRDPRFSPIRPDELKYLDISVDVLGEPEDIKSADELDVRRYGVIVSCGRRRGLLLPDLDGIDTPEQQISIAMQKGGISKSEPYKLQRFEVIRHH